MVPFLHYLEGTIKKKSLRIDALIWVSIAVEQTITLLFHPCFVFCSFDFCISNAVLILRKLKNASYEVSCLDADEVEL